MVLWVKGLENLKKFLRPLPKRLKMLRKTWFVSLLPKEHYPTNRKENTEGLRCF